MNPPRFLYAWPAVLGLALCEQAAGQMDHTTDRAAEQIPAPALVLPQVPVEPPEHRHGDCPMNVTDGRQAAKPPTPAAADTTAPPPGTDQPPSAFAQLEDALHDAASQRASRLRRIRQKLLVLDDLLKTMHAKATEPSPRPAKPSASKAEEGDASHDPVVTSSGSPSPQADEGSAAPSRNLERKQTIAKESPNRLRPAKAGAGGPVEPVDRIALADNLFGMADIQTALRIYGEIEQTSLSVSDRLWVRYQSASCYRRLGATSKAQSLYREIANSTDAPDLAATARWWLNAIQRRTRLELRHRSVQEQLKAWEDYIRERADP